MKHSFLSLALSALMASCCASTTVPHSVVHRDWSFRNRNVHDLLLELTRIAGDNLVVGEDVKTVKPITGRFDHRTAHEARANVIAITGLHSWTSGGILYVTKESRSVLNRQR